MSLLDRFRRIERSRREAPAPAFDPDTAERIEGVEGPGRAPSTPSSSGGDLERFAPPPPAQLELLPEDADRRPFTRCMRCGMDHNFLVAECTGCGARLDTPEQRAFNERLWAERQVARAEEERLHAEREAERARDAEALGDRTDDVVAPVLSALASGAAAMGRWVWQRVARSRRPG